MFVCIFHMLKTDIKRVKMIFLCQIKLYFKHFLPDLVLC